MMLSLKPIFRTIVLSMILALLIIYLGIKYHWIDYLKVDKSNNISSLEIPPKTDNKNNIPTVNNLTLAPSDEYIPQILSVKKQDNLISSMNKIQVAQNCQSLLSKSIQNSDQLNLAVVNCIVSNYQETHQAFHDSSYLQKKEQLREVCQKQLDRNFGYTNIEKQLLIGICTSDRLTQ